MLTNKRNQFFTLAVLLVVMALLAACGGAPAQPQTGASDAAAVDEAATAAAMAAAEEEKAAEEAAAMAAAEEEKAAEEAAAMAAEQATTEAMEAAAAAEEAEQEAEEAAAMAEEEVMMESSFVWPEGLASDGPLAGVDPAGQTVVWWHNHSGSREERLLAMIDQFNSENPYGITVEALNQGGYNDIREKMGAGITSGDLPGVVVGYQNDQAFYASVDALVDMDTYVNDSHWGLTEEEKADFSPGIFMQDVHPAFDNMRLGYPPNRSMEVLTYNKTWLEGLGYSDEDMAAISPELFEEIACAAAAERDDGEGGYIIRFDASQVASAALARGGHVLTEDGLAYNYNSPELLDYFTQMRRMYENGCAWVSPEPYHDAEFAARQAIFMIGSSSGLPFTQGSLDDAGNADEWGVAPQPFTTDTPRQNLYGGSVMMPYGTPENQLASWIFIHWFTGPEPQAEWAKASNYFSPRYSVGEMLEDYIQTNPKFETALNLLPYAEFEPQLISYASVRNAVSDAFNEIITTDVDIATALEELDATVAEIHAEESE
jgi:multiple sugar transport system substrate-binding protein/sn-glycerol 3-phosphate transport system substrate-binding protein